MATENKCLVMGSEECLKHHGDPHGPLFITVDIVSSCNKKCSFCEYYKPDGKFATVVGHEGRARMLALRSFCMEGKHGMTGATKVPVHFFLRDGLRSRHITDEMIQSLSKDGIIPEAEKRMSPASAVKVKPFKEIFINGKKIDL
jgi:hypothetical protein